VHFLYINFHFDLSWFIRFLRSLAAASPLRLEMSAIVVCHHADALALPSSLAFVWYLVTHSRASVCLNVSSKFKRSVDNDTTEGLSIFYPVQKFVCFKIIQNISPGSVQWRTGGVLGNKADMSFLAGLLPDHWCSEHIGRWPSM
jgi:hypothetical protein